MLETNLKYSNHGFPIELKKRKKKKKNSGTSLLVCHDKDLFPSPKNICKQFVQQMLVLGRVPCILVASQNLEDSIC